MDNQLIVAIYTDRGPSTVGARLGQMGYQILDAQGLEQGIELALAQLPDLILYDAVTDPDETLVELARLDADADAAMIPVVALAAASLLEQGLAARLPHVDEIVGMPFVWEEFLARIQAQLARRARLHAAYARKLADLRRMALDGFNPELFGPFLAMLEQAELLSADPARAGADPGVAEAAYQLDAAGQQVYRQLQNYLLYLNLAAEDQTTRVAPLLEVPVTVHARQVIVDTAQHVAARHRRAADLRLDVGDAEVMIPTVDLAKIVEELVDNGFRHTACGHTVWVSTRLDREFTLRVDDDGPGFQLSVLHELPPSRPRREDPGSLGLGLMVATHLARLHGGKLDVSSTRGIGTRATVQLGYRQA